MQATVSKISPVKLELSVEVPADAVKAEVDKAYLNLARTAKIKGFRPGKAPRNVLTQLFDPQVKSQVANSLVQTTLPKVLDDKKVIPVSTPAVEAGQVDPKAIFSYKATFEVSPEIENVTYEGFELKKPKKEVTGEMVDEQLELLRKQAAVLKAPEPPRPAKEGDVLTIDFTVTIDGKEIKEAGGEGVTVELGSKQVLPELDAGLLGKSASDKCEIAAQFAETHPRSDFREGKSGIFHITVAELKEKVPPSLDDEFAKDTGLGETLIELRAHIHTRLEKSVKDQVELALAEQIVDRLNQANPIDLPPSLVDQQTRMMEQELISTSRRLGQRLTQEMFDVMRPQIRTDAEKKVRAGLVMAAIAKKLELKVTNEDIEEGIKELAEESGKNIAKVRSEYREKGRRDILVGMILEDKILDILEGKAKIEEISDEQWQKEREAARAAAAAPAASSVETKAAEPAEAKAEGVAKKPAGKKAKK